MGVNGLRSRSPSIRPRRVRARYCCGFYFPPPARSSAARRVLRRPSPPLLLRKKAPPRPRILGFGRRFLPHGCLAFPALAAGICYRQSALLRV